MELGARLSMSHTFMLKSSILALTALLTFAAPPLWAAEGEPAQEPVEHVTMEYPNSAAPPLWSELAGAVTGGAAVLGTAATTGLGILVVMAALTLGQPPYSTTQDQLLLGAAGAFGGLAVGTAVLSLVSALSCGAVLAFLGVRSWYFNWGTEDGESMAPLPGDDLVPKPRTQYTRGITIRAPARDVWPWLVQMGADRGGLYSYEKIEAMMRCPITNADTIHPEWQSTKVGDPIRLCPKDGPPPYEVASMEVDRAFILGHRTSDGKGWADTWQFVLQPVDPNTTRLLVRNRTTVSGPMWDAIEPGVFVMEQRMLRGIKERVETPPAPPVPQEADPQP